MSYFLAMLLSSENISDMFFHVYVAIFRIAVLRLSCQLVMENATFLIAYINIIVFLIEFVFSFI